MKLTNDELAVIYLRLPPQEADALITHLRTVDAELLDLRSKIEAARAQMTEVKQSRTAWLEQHGVPISEEFVRFANSIGELETALGKQGEGQDSVGRSP